MDSLVWPWLTFALAVVAIGLAALLLMERERKKPLTHEPTEPSQSQTWGGWPFSARRTVSTDLYKEARDKLRVLDIEREILSYAIRRLYEARAEGKITEDETDRLAEKYRMDLARIKEEIARGESVVALNELEKMQDEFLRLFSERFDELNKRIEELRTISGIVPPRPEEPPEAVEEEGEEKEELEEEEVEAPEQPAEKEEPPKQRQRRRPKAPPEPEKSDAEKKVEQIVAEVEKVLERLGQMEVEE